MAEVKTVEEIRKQLQVELAEVFSSTNQLDSSQFGTRHQVMEVVNNISSRVIERSLIEFDKSIEDKLRHLKLGEAADQFIAAMKLPPVEVK